MKYLRNLLPELWLHVAWQGNVKLFLSSRGYTRCSEASNETDRTNEPDFNPVKVVQGLNFAFGRRRLAIESRQSLNTHYSKIICNYTMRS